MLSAVRVLEQNTRSGTAITGDGGRTSPPIANGRGGRGSKKDLLRDWNREGIKERMNGDKGVKEKRVVVEKGREISD